MIYKSNPYIKQKYKSICSIEWWNWIIIKAETSPMSETRH